MSRTDVHRPVRVKLADPHNRHRLRRFQTWSTELPELIPLYNTCGCPICGGQYWRKAERRKVRHGKRRQILEQLAD